MLWLDAWEEEEEEEEGRGAEVKATTQVENGKGGGESRASAGNHGRRCRLADCWVQQGVERHIGAGHDDMAGVAVERVTAAVSTHVSVGLDKPPRHD